MAGLRLWLPVNRSSVVAGATRGCQRCQPRAACIKVSVAIRKSSLVAKPESSLVIRRTLLAFLGVLRLLVDCMA